MLDAERATNVVRKKEKVKLPPVNRELAERLLLEQQLDTTKSANVKGKKKAKQKVL